MSRGGSARPAWLITHTSGGVFLIKVTRLNGTELVINSDLIESMEQTPDTVITLTNGHRLVVKESVDELINRVVQFRQACLKHVLTR
jgi:flagellar protein FlbD